MKELKNLDAIRELLASNSFYTYDYTDGLHINKEDTNIQVYSIDLGNDPLALALAAYISGSAHGEAFGRKAAVL